MYWNVLFKSYLPLSACTLPWRACTFRETYFVNGLKRGRDRGLLFYFRGTTYGYFEKTYMKINRYHNISLCLMGAWNSNRWHIQTSIRIFTLYGLRGKVYKSGIAKSMQPVFQARPWFRLWLTTYKPSQPVNQTLTQCCRKAASTARTHFVRGKNFEITSLNLWDGYCKQFLIPPNVSFSIAKWYYISSYTPPLSQPYLLCYELRVPTILQPRCTAFT